MLLVPVLDIRHGQVVRAVRGERDTYRPVRSQLVAGSEPTVVARALLDASGGDTLYIADLDVLLGEAPQRALLQALGRSLGGVALWLDAGFADAAAARSLLDAIGVADVTPVFGTESLHSAAAPPANALLSLDSRCGRPLDAGGLLWDDAARWPERVIVMTLDRVGTDSGPDLDSLRRLRERSPQTRFIGAGGIRDDADLADCAAAGAYAWLVASALHDGRLSCSRGGAKALASKAAR